MTFSMLPDHWRRALTGIRAALTASSANCNPNWRRWVFRRDRFTPRSSPRSMPRPIASPSHQHRTEPSDLFIADTGDAVNVEPGETLLAALERNGYHPDFSCRAGICGSCKLRVLEGDVDQQGEILSPAEKANGYVLSCIAHPMGQVTLASGGRAPAGTVRRKITGISGGRSRTGVTGIRAATLVGASALLVGSWALTNHQPNSWIVAAAALPAAQQTAPADATLGKTPGVSPSAGTTTTATRTPGNGGTGGNGGGVVPTATAASSGGGSGNPPPPAATATPKPKPAPTATSTPSPKVR